MPLTHAQQTALKADIAADATLNALPANSDGFQAIADAYNALAAPDYFVWRTDAPVNDILNNVTWANFTPNDAITTGNAAIWLAWAAACEVKQFNLELMTIGRTTFDASRPNLRAGLNDATSNLPTGNNGNLRQGGWTNILIALSRKARRVEKLFAFDDGAGIGNTVTDPRGAQTNPDSMGFEGTLSATDVQNAKNQG